MTVEMLEERLQKLAIDAPDAGRISARVLARQTRRRIRVPRLATGFVAFVVLAAHEIRLDLAHIAGKERRCRQHEEHLHELHAEVERYCHMASTMRSATSAPNTRLR